MSQLKKDKHGNILTSPVVGWTTGTLADVAILLAINYAETPREIETGGKSVQLALTPQQGLELAQKLATLANRLLEPPPSGTARH